MSEPKRSGFWLVLAVVSLTFAALHVLNHEWWHAFASAYLGLLFLWVRRLLFDRDTARYELSRYRAYFTGRNLP